MDNSQSVIASALPSLEVCPCYTGGEAGDAAKFGSAFHKAMETGDIAHALTPEALKAAKDGQGFTQPDIEEAFSWCNEWLHEMIEKYKPEYDLIEVEGSIEMIPGRRFFIDRLFALPDNAYVVIDWKTGRSQYDASDNLQGMCYALSLFQQDPLCDQVAVVFVTPFTKQAYYHVFEREGSDALAMRLYRVTQAAYAENPKPNPGSACKYCGRFGKDCPAIEETLKDAASGKLATALDLARENPEEMGKLLDLTLVLDRLIKDIKEAANDMRFQRGLEIPGYRVVHTNSKTKVADAPAIVKYLTSKGLDLEACLSYIQFSVADVEKMVGQASQRGEREIEMQALRDRGWLVGGTGDGTPYLRKVK